jgi:hypothetical protein
LHKNASSLESAGAFILGADFVSTMELRIIASGILSRRSSIAADVSFNQIKSGKFFEIS